MIDVVTFSKAQIDLNSVLDRIVENADVTIIARDDAPAAVIMSLDTYNSLRETADLPNASNEANHLSLSIKENRLTATKGLDAAKK